MSMDTLLLDGERIDYFFDERPPSSIESDKEGAEIRLWLRTWEAYEEEYGDMDFNMDDLDEETLNRFKEAIESQAAEGTDSTDAATEISEE